MIIVLNISFSKDSSFFRNKTNFNKLFILMVNGKKKNLKILKDFLETELGQGILKQINI